MTKTAAKLTKELKKTIVTVCNLDAKAISVNTTSEGKPCHTDNRKSHVPSMIIGLNHFSKGRLGIECPQGTIPGWRSGQLDARQGIFHDIRHRPVLFSSRTLLHGTEQWQGPERRILTSWTPQIASQNHPYFNTTLGLYGFLPPLSPQELDSYALSTYYGHYAVKQRRLKGKFARRTSDATFGPATGTYTGGVGGR